MIQLPSTLIEPPAPPPASHGDPPGESSGTPFSTVLDDHQARTAAAEGHQSERSQTPDASVASHDDDRDGDDDRAPAKPAGDRGADAAAVAALLGGVPLSADGAVRVVAPGRPEPEPVGGRVLTAPGARTPVFDRGTCVLTATRPIGVAGSPAGASPAAAPSAGAPARVPGGPAVPAAASSPSLPIGLGAAAAEGQGGGLGAEADVPTGSTVAAAARIASALQAAASHGAGPAASAMHASATAAATPAASPAQAGSRGAAQPAAQPHQAAPAPAPTAAPSAAPAPAASASAQAVPADAPRGIGLEHAVETVRLALHAAAERGVTQARISLNPRELGSIEVHLRQTADGLVVRVVAVHAAAAQLLQSAGADLRRSLESQGLNVLSLDVGASGEQGGRSADRRALAGEASSRGRGPRAGDEADTDPLAPLDGATGATTTTTLALSNGALVDVLA